jgi:7-carboxy-7-deazaguanine synthase
VLTVNEVFHSIQGEGTRAGRPCLFVRLTGCPLRCHWCDTAYAFHEGERRSEDDVLAELARYGTRLVQLTGGEPLAQPAAFDFTARLLDAGYDVLVETSGHVHTEGLDARAVVIPRMDWRNVERLRAQDEVKFVILDRADFEWSRDVVRERALAARCTVLFSPVHGVLDPGRLAAWILEDGVQARLQVQLHKYLWPGALRGV